jgi:hypothetical protein
MSGRELLNYKKKLLRKIVKVQKPSDIALNSQLISSLSIPPPHAYTQNLHTTPTS